MLRLAWSCPNNRRRNVFTARGIALLAWETGFLWRQTFLLNWYFYRRSMTLEHFLLIERRARALIIDLISLLIPVWSIDLSM